MERQEHLLHTLVVVYVWLIDSFSCKVCFFFDDIMCIMNVCIEFQMLSNTLEPKVGLSWINESWFRFISFFPLYTIISIVHGYKLNHRFVLLFFFPFYLFGLLYATDLNRIGEWRIEFEYKYKYAQTKT